MVTVSAAAPLVVPNSLATIEGNSNNAFPFSIAASSMRYQQVFAASEFGTQPLTITQITFRPDGPAGNAFSTTLSNVQINLSTTSAAPDGLSSTFANNVGGDDTVVFPSGPLALSSLDTGSGPRDFDIVINLTTPFVYDPSAGNLLFDARNFSGGSTTAFDHQFTPSDPVSRVFGAVGSSTGTPDTSGLVAAFELVLPFIEVEIDIKPGNEPISINCENDKGVISVAILTTGEFDATTVEHTTVIFGGASETHLDKKADGPRRHEEDVDNDGGTDLVLHFQLAATNLTCESTEGSLTGETFDGGAIAGTDAVRMVGGD